MFKRILIANRGEIAVRIIRACREMGIESVAVFSDVDRQALHVRKADHAYHIGPATASESYLNIDKILDVASRSGAEAIHPGYGFLSENARFARACRDAGIKFIGPTPESMEMMGSKTRARQNMKKAGVPFVPGSEQGHGASRPPNSWPSEIGYPVMLKAAAGGGGKGMRLVQHARRTALRLRERPQRGPARLRRQRSLHREAHRQPAPHRDADLRRRARQRRLPGRARVLGAAPPSEGAGRIAFAHRRCRHAPPHGRNRGPRRQGRQLSQRRHRRVPGRSSSATSTSWR